LNLIAKVGAIRQVVKKWKRCTIILRLFKLFCKSTHVEISRKIQINIIVGSVVPLEETLEQIEWIQFLFRLLI